MAKEQSIQSRVLAVIRANGKLSVRSLRAALGLEGEKGYARISRAAQDLEQAGYVRRVAPATYQFIGVPKDLDYAGTQRRIVRIIRIRTKRNAPFTARKLAEMAECSINWAQRYVLYLRKQGYLESVGFDRVGRCMVKAPTYLAPAEKLNDDWPAMRRISQTKLIDVKVAELREMAYQVANECSADKKTLQKLTDQLRQMIDLAETIIGEKRGRLDKKTTANERE